MKSKIEINFDVNRFFIIYTDFKLYTYLSKHIVNYEIA